MRTARVLLAALAVFTATTTLAVTSEPAVAEVVSPLTLRHDDAVYGDVLTVGNAVLGCPDSPAATKARCEAAMRGENSDNNNQFDMTRVNESSLAGTFDSSVARLTIPAGATVSYARLFWGGNTGTYRSPVGGLLNRCDVSGADVDPAPGDPLTTSPRLSVDGASAVPVAPENAVEGSATANGPHYYTAEGDVTTMFASASTGSPIDVAVGDVWAPNGAGCVGGWSVVVVYEYDKANAKAPSRRHIHIYGGHVLQRSNDAPTTVTVDGFYRYGTRPVKASLTAHEGDRAASGDQFKINGKNIPNPHDGATNNFFLGIANGATTPTEVGSPYNLGTDVDEFDVPDSTIPQGATSADLTLSTRGDTYVVQELALSVPVPDLKISKTSPSGDVKPGDTVAYKVTAENISELDYPGATFTDDLSEVLDDATWDSVTADVGNAEYTAPKLTWTGNVPAGEKVTVTYKLTVNDPVSGDGKLINNVLVAPGSTLVSNCDEDSEDPACNVTITIPEKPDPTPTPSKSDTHGNVGPEGPGGGPGDLAATGSPSTVWTLAAVGAVLVVLGAAGVWFGARRRRNG